MNYKSLLVIFLLIVQCSLFGIDTEPVFPLTIEDPLKNNEKFVTEFFNMLATLGLIIAFIIAIAWIFKRTMNMKLEKVAANSAIKVLERRNISPKTLLYLIEVEDKVILFSESHNGVTKLAEYSSEK